jgi:hypothetical protein
VGLLSFHLPHGMACIHGSPKYFILAVSSSSGKEFTAGQFQMAIRMRLNFGFLKILVWPLLGVVYHAIPNRKISKAWALCRNFDPGKIES